VRELFQSSLGDYSEPPLKEVLRLCDIIGLLITSAHGGSSLYDVSAYLSTSVDGGFYLYDDIDC